MREQNNSKGIAFDINLKNKQWLLDTNAFTNRIPDTRKSARPAPQPPDMKDSGTHSEVLQDASRFYQTHVASYSKPVQKDRGLHDVPLISKHGNVSENISTLRYDSVQPPIIIRTRYWLFIFYTCFIFNWFIHEIISLNMDRTLKQTDILQTCAIWFVVPFLFHIIALVLDDLSLHTKTIEWITWYAFTCAILLVLIILPVTLYLNLWDTLAITCGTDNVTSMGEWGWAFAYSILHIFYLLTILRTPAREHIENNKDTEAPMETHGSSQTLKGPRKRLHFFFICLSLSSITMIFISRGRPRNFFLDIYLKLSTIGAALFSVTRVTNEEPSYFLQMHI